MGCSSSQVAIAPIATASAGPGTPQSKGKQTDFVASTVVPAAPATPPPLQQQKAAAPSPAPPPPARPGLPGLPSLPGLPGLPGLPPLAAPKKVVVVPSTAPAAATADAASDPAAAINGKIRVNLAVDLCTVEGLRGAFGDTDVFVHARVVDELSDSVVLEARSAVCRRERVCTWTPPHALAFADVRRALTMQLIVYDRDDLGHDVLIGAAQTPIAALPFSSSNAPPSQAAPLSLKLNTQGSIQITARAVEVSA